MLVRGEDLDRFARVLCRLLGNGIRELFLNAAASSGVADFGFFGRGFWIDQPIAFNASQPRCGATEVRLSSPAIQAATLRLDHSPPSGGGRAIVRSIARHRPSSPTLARWCDHAPKARLPGSAAMGWHPHIPQTALPTPRHSNDPRPSPCVPISRLMAPKLICFARPCESLSTSSQSAGNRISPRFAERKARPVNQIARPNTKIYRFGSAALEGVPRKK